MIVPDSQSPGRGYRGAREVIVFETNDRKEIDERLGAIKDLVGISRLFRAGCRRDE